jgi:predicted nuclease with TOPRIM domain
MSDDVYSRLSELEQRVEELETEVERRERDLVMLAVQADLDVLPDQPCPECDTQTLTKRSGLSWSKAICTECGSEWYLQS